MKAINRKTKEVVTIISYRGDTRRSPDDYVDFIDDEGNEHYGVSLNFYWDFEPLDANEFIRETAKAIVAAMYASPAAYGTQERMTDIAITQAKMLAGELFTRNYF